MSEQTIEQVNSTIFLGVIIDEQLSWKYHVNRVAMKRSKMTGVMAKVRQLFLPCKILLILHNTMIYPIQFNLLLTILFRRVLTALDFSLFSAFRRKLLQLLPFQILGTTQAHCLNH